MSEPRLPATLFTEIRFACFFPPKGATRNLGGMTAEPKSTRCHLYAQGCIHYFENNPKLAASGWWLTKITKWERLNPRENAKARGGSQERLTRKLNHEPQAPAPNEAHCGAARPAAPRPGKRAPTQGLAGTFLSFQSRNTIIFTS